MLCIFSLITFQIPQDSTSLFTCDTSILLLSGTLIPPVICTLVTMRSSLPILTKASYFHPFLASLNNGTLSTGAIGQGTLIQPQGKYVTVEKRVCDHTSVHNNC